MHRALITGAAGFVGQRLAAHLVANSWEVVACDVPGIPGDHTPLDLADPKSIDHAVDISGIVTHVFHLAAITFVPDSAANPAHTFDVNTTGTVRLLQTLLKRRPQVRVINVSTSEVYGAPAYLPVDEAHPMAPVNPYAISKQASDALGRWMHRHQGLDVVTMRPFNHSGPGQSEKFVLSSFAKQTAEIMAGRHEPTLNVGNLEVARDFLHVDDVVRAYELAALKGDSGAVYNIASGQAYLLHDVVSHLITRSGKRIEVRVDEARYRPSHVPELRGSHDALTEATGWTPETSFEALLDALLAYWQEQLD